MTIAEAKLRLTILLLWAMLGLEGEPAESCSSPFREDAHPSFSVYAQGTRWFDHATGEGGDAIDFLARAIPGLSKKAACRKFIELAAGLPVVVDASLLEASPATATSGPRGGDRSSRKASRKPETRPCLPKTHDPATMPRPSIHGEWRGRLARLRHVSPAAVDLAHARGLVHFCSVTLRGYWYEESIPQVWVDKPMDDLAWVVTDNRRLNAQMRLLDGQPWPRESGDIKSKTWPGSWGAWPIGAADVGPFPSVLLVEGGPDLLAAHHFIAAAGREDSVGVVAMMGAGMVIPEEALPLFAGKRVRIYPDADEAGKEAAGRWGDQLRAAGADVDAFNLSGLRKADGTAVKDLNDCTCIHPEDAGQLEGLLPR